MKRGVTPWVAATAVGVAAAWTLARFLPDVSAAEGSAASFRWVTLANTALAASTALYATHLWLRTDVVGRVATALAALGALGVLAGLALAALFTGEARVGLYEGTALLSAGAVIAYLLLERAYSSRDAGIVVMPAVMLAVACEMWLIANGLALPGSLPGGFGTYWEAGYRFAMVLGYGPIALAGAVAALALVGRRECTPASLARLTAGLAVGAPLLLLAAGMGAVWTLFDAHASARPAGFLFMSSLATAAALLAWVRMRELDALRQARLVLGVFVVATAGLLAAGRLGALLA
ncbi:MAG TPA: hypothetical protein VF876_05595 [Burkholderiales bacterium]